MTLRLFIPPAQDSGLTDPGLEGMEWGLNSQKCLDPGCSTLDPGPRIQDQGPRTLDIWAQAFNCSGDVTLTQTHLPLWLGL